jgi:hypothetical protein
MWIFERKMRWSGVKRWLSAAVVYTTIETFNEDLFVLIVL